MKLHKILPIIFLIIAMMISCSQETVINENISGEATTPDTKICVNIKTENSRTVRPEITKWEITVTNKSDANLTFSRTIDGKATSATFVNVTDGEYDITVRGFNKDNKIILKNGSNSFYIKPNTVNVCEIIPEDNFAYDTNGNPYNGNLSIQISGLKDLFTEGETLLLTCTKLGSNDKTSKSETLPYEYTNGTLIREITEIPVGSYKIEITHNDEAKTKTKVNLVKDPVVNIYDNTTTEINWEWNYDSDKIKADQDLKGIKIPVWNKSTEGNIDSTLSGYGEAWTIPARNGYLTANALFAEPIWDEEKTYMFTVEVSDSTSPTVGDPINYSANIPASELEFINCTYDDGDLWVLSGTSEMNVFFDDNNSALEQEYYCYVLKNLSTGDDYKFIYTDSLKQDFTVVTIEEKKYLFSIFSSGTNQIAYAELKKDETVKITNFFEDTGLSSNLGNITTLYISRNSNTDENNKIPIYIATALSGNANIYTGTISTNENGTLTLNINTDNPPLSLDIYSFISDENIVAQLQEQSNDFSNYVLMISDMYINEDKSKLYVTASCVNYNGNSWNNNQNHGFYHSFGGLFVYELDEAGNLKKDDDGSITVESYGINNNEITTIDPETENDIDPNPFLTTGGEGILELEENIMQAVANDSQYFAGPRYIIPAGKDLLIVDSGFYGVYFGEIKRFINCEKRNRIFTFNTGTKGLSLTTLDDSISFDYDYLTNSSQN